MYWINVATDSITIPDEPGTTKIKYEEPFCTSYIIIRVSEKLSSHENRHQKEIYIWRHSCLFIIENYECDCRSVQWTKGHREQSKQSSKCIGMFGNFSIMLRYDRVERGCSRGAWTNISQDARDDSAYAIYDRDMDYIHGTIASRFGTLTNCPCFDISPVSVVHQLFNAVRAKRRYERDTSGAKKFPSTRGVTSCWRKLSSQRRFGEAWRT